MTFTTSASLFILMISLALIPSSSVVLVITRSITHGVANGISVSLGIVLGDLIFILLVVFGLSIIAQTMGWLFLIIKYIGATYLIWLGYTLITSRPEANISIEKTNKKGSLVASFLAGLLLTLGDIKAIFFYVSLFPSFVNLEALQFSDVVTIMLVTIITVGGVKIFYAFSANKVAAISKKYNFESKAKRTAGGFMIGAGSYLIVKS